MYVINFYIDNKGSVCQKKKVGLTYNPIFIASLLMKHVFMELLVFHLIKESILQKRVIIYVTYKIYIVE